MEKESRGRDQFRKFKPAINALCALLRPLPRGLRMRMYRATRCVGGKPMLAFRYAVLRTLVRKMGDNVAIYPHVYLPHLENLSLGDNVSVHPMCYIDADGGIDIGDNVSIAHGVTIMSASHKYDDTTTPIKDQGLFLRQVRIGNDVWIGAKATVLYGLTVADGSIVAANAVVTKDFEPYSILAGVPAKVIKTRKVL